MIPSGVPQAYRLLPVIPEEGFGQGEGKGVKVEVEGEGEAIEVAKRYLPKLSEEELKRLWEEIEIKEEGKGKDKREEEEEEEEEGEN